MNPHAIFEIDGQGWDSWAQPGLFKRVSVDLTTGQCSEAIWELFDPDFQIINRYSNVALGSSSLPVIRVWLGLGSDSASRYSKDCWRGLAAQAHRRRFAAMT